MSNNFISKLDREFDYLIAKEITVFDPAIYTLFRYLFYLGEVFDH